MTNQEREDELREDQETWLRSPFTQVTLDQVQKDLRPLVFEALLRTCKSTTDPNVAYWRARYEAVLDLEKLLRTGEITK